MSKAFPPISETGVRNRGQSTLFKRSPWKVDSDPDFRVAAIVAAGPTAIVWGKDAWSAYKAATASYSLSAASGTGALGSGAMYTVGAGFGAGMDTLSTHKDFTQGFDERFSYQGLGGSMAVGALGGIYDAKMFQWAGIPNALSNGLTPAGAVIRINKMAAGAASNKAAQAAIESHEKSKQSKSSGSE